MSRVNVPFRTMGVDIGSSMSKCVVLDGGKEVTASAVCQGGTGTSGPEKSVRDALDSIGLDLTDMAYIVATGYGRNAFKSANRTYSELSCHARGAVYLCPGVRTVIDVGGQDCKAMRLTANGELDGFSMNDKCAAGTGRFLEVMARVLEVGLSELGSHGLRARNVVEITSTCTVFAETEVISQLSNGADKSALIAGIHRSVAVKAAGVAKRLGVVEPVFFSGGVSRSEGVIQALSCELGLSIRTDPRAQLAGAIGAAVLACEKLRSGQAAVNSE